MSLREQIRSRRAEILAIAVRHGARDVRIFGSVARGEDDKRSDVDFLVAFDEEAGLMDHAALLVDLENLLGRKVDVAADDCLRPRIRERVLAEAVPL